MEKEMRNVFAAFADESGIAQDKEMRGTDSKGETKPSEKTQLGVEAGLRRSNRSNKGVCREVFDPSHIPSPKRTIPVNQGKTTHDNSQSNKNKTDTSDSSAAKAPKGNRGKKVSKDVATSEESESESDFEACSDPKKRFCLCQKPHGGRFMISCDVCGEWFHGDCVGISVGRGKQMEKKREEYVCPSCVNNSKDKKGKRHSSLEKTVKRKDVTVAKAGVKLKGYAHGEPDADHKKTELAAGKLKQKAADDSAPQRAKQRKCIVSTCQNKAVADSIYCSNVCILRHAKESVIGIGKTIKKTSKEKASAPKQETKDERILRKIREASSRGKVAVMCMKTGKIFANASAPLKDDVEAFLKENQTFQKLRLPKSLRQKLVTKQQIPSQKPKPSKESSTDRPDSIKQSDDPDYIPQEKQLSDPPQSRKPKPAKELNSEKRESVKKTSDGSDHKPQDKHFSNPYKQFTPISPRNEKVSDKPRKHKMHRQEPGGDAKRQKHRSDSERRHSTDKNASAKSITAKRDGRSLSDEKMNLKKEQSSDENEVRKNVRKTLQGILQQRSNNSEDLKMHPDSINRLVHKVEDSLHKLFSGVNSKYKNRYRSIMFNLKDEKNEGLWRKVILGEVPSSRLVKMTAEEMASKELAQWRKHELKQELEMIQELEVAKRTVRPVAKITHKGEIVINEDFSDLTESHLNTSGEKPTIAPQRIRRISATQPELLDPVTSHALDTTSEHNRHLFDLNCMICTGQVKEEDSNLAETQAVKRSTSIILSNEAQTPAVENETDEDIIQKINAFSNRKEKSHDVLAKPSPEEDDEYPANSPSSHSPENTESDALGVLKPESKTLKPSWENFLWTGVISMAELSSFRSNAYVVSGNGKELMNVVPRKLAVDGRIHPKVVWEYLTKVRSFSNKEVCVIQFRASSEEDRVGYVSMLSYFSHRRRFGVVSNQDTNDIKDIYLAPLLETDEVPRQLLPFNGPGIPANHPSMLLGIIVRCIPDVAEKQSRDFETRLAEITGKSQRKRKFSDDISISDRSVLRALSMSSSEGKSPDSTKGGTSKKDEDDDEEYNPETADFKDILDEEMKEADTSKGQEEDEEAYDPEKLIFDDDGTNDKDKSMDDEDDVPYDPEVEAERLESTEVKALQEKAAYLERMKQELEMKKAELAKEEMTLQQHTAPPPAPPLKPTKLVSQTQSDPRMAARLNNKSKPVAPPTDENPLQKIYSVLNIERPSPM